MKLGEGQAQLLFGAVIVALILCIFFVHLPDDPKIFGVSTNPIVWTLMTALSLGGALLYFYWAVTGRRAMAVWDLVSPAFVAFFGISQIHGFHILYVLNWAAVVIDLAIVALIVLRRVLPRVSQ